MDITITISDDMVAVLDAFMATQQVQGVDEKGQPVTTPKYVDETDLIQQNLADGLFAGLLSNKEFAAASPTISAAQDAVDVAVAALADAKATQASNLLKKMPPVVIGPVKVSI